jgi:hypothetical protein
MTEIETDGWAEYKRRVLFQLDTLTDHMEKMETKLDDLRTSVTILKTKAGFIGGLAGLLVAVGLQIVLMILKKG